MPLFETIVLFCVIGVVSINAAVYMSHAIVNPDHPGKCSDSIHHHPKNTCLEILCSKAMFLTTYRCGIVLPPPGYHNEWDLTKPYPDCCTNFVKNDGKKETEPEPLSVKSEPTESSADSENKHP